MNMKLPEYNALKSLEMPGLQGEWSKSSWKKCEILRINQFRKEGSSHRPRTQAKVLYTDNALYCIFRVYDRFVKCIHTTSQGEVWKDSCVEIFLHPNTLLGYFNFEINCGGTLRCCYNEISMKKRTLRVVSEPLSPKLRKRIEIFHLLPVKVDPEIQTAITWSIECKIPFSVFESHVGKFKILGGEKWRANFYKCGDETSHPHWASWSAVKELNFHRPQDFGILHFVKNHKVRKEGE